MAVFTNVWLTSGSLLIEKQPFTGAEILKLKNWTAHNPYFKYITTAEVPLSKLRVYQSFLELNDPQKEEAFIRQYPFDIHPVEDDRPFFFRYSRWSDLLTHKIPFFELNIVVLLSLLSVVTALCIFWPLNFY